eukprot:CAMPEP_0172801250 /NCGR_PEP_ID=MMETSP1075-20121228/3072_1 /TAXON_ID=2916 /ORGANISM="Ceratium fusus, Strain PA161109" /LENGTH=316 /DNA_ID=CAMNT_0013639269 /DNA_START=33 /DNA_END=981 /DNA_ORIENTATION=-
METSHMASLGEEARPVDRDDGTAMQSLAKQPQLPTSASGSTSGATSTAESACDVSEYEDSEDNDCLQYPPAWCVKNTFVDVFGDVSLTPIRSLRRTASAPATSFGGAATGAEDGSSITCEREEEDVIDGARRLLLRSSTSLDLEHALNLGDRGLSGNGSAPQPPPWTPSLEPVEVLMPLPPPPTTPPSWPDDVAAAVPGTFCTIEAPAVLRLADHLLGDSEQLVTPKATITVGSATHPDQCKPCAFVWREVGCGMEQAAFSATFAVQAKDAGAKRRNRARHGARSPEYGECMAGPLCFWGKKRGQVEGVSLACKLT